MLVTLCLTGLAAIGGVLAVIYSGVYDVSATSQHTAPVYWALEIGMLKAVQRRARGIEAPPLDDPQLVRRGFRPPSRRLRAVSRRARRSAGRGGAWACCRFPTISCRRRGSGAPRRSTGSHVMVSK